jgi:hypothetical protein
MRVPDYLRNVRQSRDLLRRPLCITSGNNDFAPRIVPLNTPNGGTGIALCSGSNRAGVEYYPFGAGRAFRLIQSPLLKLALDGGAVGLSGSATEI